MSTCYCMFNNQEDTHCYSLDTQLSDGLLSLIHDEGNAAHICNENDKAIPAAYDSQSENGETPGEDEIYKPKPPSKWRIKDLRDILEAYGEDVKGIKKRDLVNMLRDLRPDLLCETNHKEEKNKKKITKRVISDFLYDLADSTENNRVIKAKIMNFVEEFLIK